MSVFVDTSVFYAAADRSDRSNSVSRDALGDGSRLVTSDHVVVETWILLRHRMGWSIAERWLDSVSGIVDVEVIGIADLKIAREIGEAFADQDFSLVDRTSFAVMERLGIHRAASLDRHFAVYRFGPGRRSAFDVVPRQQTRPRER